LTNSLITRYNISSVSKLRPDSFLMKIILKYCIVLYCTMVGHVKPWDDKPPPSGHCQGYVTYKTTYHSLHSCVTIVVLTTNGLINGNPPFSTPPPQNRRSLTDCQKNCSGDSVHDLYPNTKFGADPSIGGVWANG